jgi:hypothetical protein
LEQPSTASFLEKSNLKPLFKHYQILVKMPENQKSELDTTELIGLVEGTVSELKDYVRENNFSDPQLEQLLRAETASKDRKTAKKFLRKRIEDREFEQNTSNPSKDTSKEETEKLEAEDTSLSREALLQMLGGTVEDVKEYVKENNPSDNELQSLLHAEKMVKDRKTVVKFLKSYSRKKELEEDFHKAETDMKELKEDLETIEENVLEEDVELELDQIPEPADNKESEDESKEPEKEETEVSEQTNEESDSDSEEDPGESEEEDSSESGETDSEDDEEDSEQEEGQEAEDEEDDLTEMEKKRNILEDLEMELSEKELEQIGLEELEKLEKEKEKREQLIEKLSTKFDREQLEKVTTKDLEKLSEEVGEPEEISKQEAQRKEEAAKRQKEKDEKRLKEEAQQDLEMMMGAVKNEGETEDDSEPGAVDQLKELPDKFKGILNRGGNEEEEESTGFDRSKTIEVLESYSEAEDREAAVKTAQVMKGYLEYALGIDREMTYAELAEKMESQELESENINTLIEFYRSMKISVYTGDVETDNIDEVIEAAKATVKELG